MMPLATLVTVHPPCIDAIDGCSDFESPGSVSPPQARRRRRTLRFRSTSVTGMSMPLSSRDVSPAGPILGPYTPVHETDQSAGEPTHQAHTDENGPVGVVP